ncbi:PREDICTED: transmembrane protein 156 [Condylura cristata]|uniref:transmembrane protein 156 n=1 Tax=Condylura cristata TaxID=143302 RepID=UPI0003345ADC|nr:PREDICTED: transmembrane protein 156 [Condylura cristata]
MTKTVLLKFLLAVVITFTLILPEYFKTPKGNTLELSCLEVCLQPIFTYSFPFNFSLVAFLKPPRENQTILGVFLNQSNFENFTRLCQDITREFNMCCSCLVCETKESINFTSQEQTSKVLVMRGSMEEKENDFHSPCQHFSFIVPPMADYLEDYNFTCHLNSQTKMSAILEEVADFSSLQEKSGNHTYRIKEDPNNCIHISLHLEVDAKNFICFMKITWYALVLSVFIFLFIVIIHKILEGHRRAKKWQSHKYHSTCVLLRGSDSEKLQTLNVRVVSASNGKSRETDDQHQVTASSPEPLFLNISGLLPPPVNLSSSHYTLCQYLIPYTLYQYNVGGANIILLY